MADAGGADAEWPLSDFAVLSSTYRVAVGHQQLAELGALLKGE